MEKKRSEARHFYLFACIFFLHSLSSLIFSLLLFSSLTLATSALPSVHIIGSLTCKLPSTRKSNQVGYSLTASGRFPGLLEKLQEVYAVDRLVKLQFVQLVGLQLYDGKSLSESVWSIFLRSRGLSCC